MALVRQLDGFDSEPRGKNSVERCRRAATLKVTEHATMRFSASAFRDLARDNFANSSQPKLAAFHIAFHLTNKAAKVVASAVLSGFRALHQLTLR
jgi:hypothetical protein